MCFYNDDCEWSASVFEEKDAAAIKEIRCHECSRKIQPGEFVHHIYMQEAEECKACEDGECECQLDKCCQCAKPTFGETFDYDRCQECHKFLQAIEDAELAAGCRIDESRPPLEMLLSGIQDVGRHDAKKYVQVAAQKYPELKQSGYLGRMWNRAFV